MISSAVQASLEWIAAARWRAAAFLVALSLAAFLPGISTLQPMDRDEPRFAQASKQMLETRDFIDIRFQDEARHKKPVGIYWLQSIVVATGDVLGVDHARTQIWLYRIPSQIGATLAAVLTWWALLAFLPARLALLGGALMAVSILLGVEARLAKTDAVLAACAVAAFGALIRVWLDWARALPFALHPRIWLVFWGAMALAVIVKGPILPMVVAFPVLLMSWRERSFGWTRPLRWKQGLALVTLVALPWLIAIAWKSGGAFFAESVGKDMLGKVAEGQEKHGAPPGFYFFAFFGTFWPAAPVAAMAGYFAWRHWREPLVAFLLAWIVPSWLIFEAVPTKLPHYVLPLYVAVTGLALLAVARDGIDMGRRGAFAWRADRVDPSCSADWLASRQLVAGSHAAFHRPALPSGGRWACDLGHARALAGGVRGRAMARRAGEPDCLGRRVRLCADDIPVSQTVATPCGNHPGLGLPQPAGDHRRLSRAEPRFPRRHRA